MKKTLIFIFVLFVLSISCVNAADINKTDIATSQDTFIEDLNNSSDNSTIFLDDGNYICSEVVINKSVSFIGSNETYFNGGGTNHIFTINNNVNVLFRNINFVNAYTNTSGSVLDIKNATVVVDNCSFINNTMSISNFGNLTIINSYFDNNSCMDKFYVCGGAINNQMDLYINNTYFINSYAYFRSMGASIYNNGRLLMNNSVIAGSYAKDESKGSALFNNRNCTILNSIIENNTIERSDFNYIRGCIFNQGCLKAIGCIFRNNSGIYKAPNTWYEGTPNIYSVGDLNLTYNAFIGNVYFNGISRDLFINGAKSVYIDTNWWECENNPFDESRINLANITSWVILDLPNYLALNINETINITASWVLSDGGLVQKIFPDLSVIFNDTYGNQIGNSFEFNYSQSKGSYDVDVFAYNFKKTILVEVGKIPTFININTNNITYNESLYINLSSNLLNSNVSVILNNKKYILKLVDGIGNLTVNNLNPGYYELYVVLEGDENYFKSFNKTIVCVSKIKTNLTINNISNIKIDESLIINVNIIPDITPIQANLYINGIFNRTVYLYDEITNLTFSNLNYGEYNITIEVLESLYYTNSISSKSFNVSKYDSNLNVNISDINIGEVAFLIITSDITANITLMINGVNQTIFIKNNTNISIPNLSAGMYNITLIFDGDVMYYKTNISTSFNVLKYSPGLVVNISGNNIHVETNINCTGIVNVYVNLKSYSRNLLDGKCDFKVEWDLGTNYIFVVYDGDDYFSNQTFNTSVGEEVGFTINGGDISVFEYNDFNYSVNLIEDNNFVMPNRLVSILFNDTIYNVMTNNRGSAQLKLNLKAGEYDIFATYKNKTIINKIHVKPIIFELKVQNISYLDIETINILFDDNISGKMNFQILNILNKTVDIVDNKAQVNVSNLIAGNYTIYTYYINDIFNSDSVISNFSVFKINPKITVKTDNILPNESEIINITLSNDATGNITVVMLDKSYTSTVINGETSFRITNLTNGFYNISIFYSGDNNYNNLSLNSSFSVRDNISNIILNVDNVCYGEDVTVFAKFMDNVTGEIIFHLNNISQIVEIKNNQAQCNFKSLNAGEYELKVEYSGDENYIPLTNSTSFKVYKLNSTIELYTFDVCLNENIEIFAKLSPNATGHVFFSMIGYYSPRPKEIYNSTSSWYISPLETGNYTIIASYNGDDNYNPSNTTFILNVNQVRAVLSVLINDVSINDKVGANIYLNDMDNNTINGIVNLTISGKSYLLNVNNGRASLVIGKLSIGNYTFIATYEGTDEYSKSQCSGAFEVYDAILNVNLTANNLIKYYKGNQKLQILLLSNNGKVITNARITVKINNVSYLVITNSEGMAYLDVNLSSGSYIAYITFNGNNSYHSASTVSLINILPTVNASDLFKLVGSANQYFAIFLDSAGRALSNTLVKFIVNNRIYKVNTLPNGVVRININLSPGIYKITAINPMTGEKITNIIKVYNKISGNKDLVMYYGTFKTYKVHIYKAKTNSSVIFKINGKIYKVKCDKQGYAKLKIKQKPGNYIIKVICGGYSVSNKIMIKPLLITKNVIKKFKKDSKFKFKVLNSKKKQLVKIKFKGKIYKLKTNKKGLGFFKIPKNLKKGKYGIKTTYNDYTVFNWIAVI